MSMTIAFDIEVAGFPWSEVDEITRGYLLNRARTPEDRDAVPEKTALFPGLGKVIAIGLWLVEQERGLILLEGKSAADKEWEKVPNSKIFRGLVHQRPAYELLEDRRLQAHRIDQVGVELAAELGGNSTTFTLSR